MGVSETRYGVKHVRDVRIPLRDGLWMACDLFMPEPLDSQVPALLELLPYRKNDYTAARWNAHHYFAARGYVGVRADVRGTGDSPGVPRDEYTVEEQLDAVEAIAWLAAQRWCNGRVAMFGTSYGGFNAIQVAMRRPPALACIAPHAATDHRYADDMHYYGGCLTALDQLPYPLRMIAQNALPPGLDLPEWEDLWKQRLEAKPWMLEWHRHQTYDAYWKQGSLAADYDAIQCPVFHIGAWHDAYTNALFRMAEALPKRGVPFKALVGPWTHARPNNSPIGPNADHLHEMLRWFDHWLLDRDTGVLDEPPITLYVQQAHRPERFPKTIPGYWRFEGAWPPERTEWRRLYLTSERRLDETPCADAGELAYDYDPTIGTAAGAWCPSDAPYGIAEDQRADDARSLTFETGPLAEQLEILGIPALTVHVASTAPVAFFVAKLSDVAPDDEGGGATLITRGGLNATRRRGLERAEALVPGEVYALEIPLRVISYVVPAGHRLRLSVSSADWPLIWPSPNASANMVSVGPERRSTLRLPVVAASAPGAAGRVPALRPPPELPETAKADSVPGRYEVARDEATGTATVRVGRDGTVTPIGPPGTSPVSIHTTLDCEASVVSQAPHAARVWGTATSTLEQCGERFESAAQATVSSDAAALHLDITLDVRRNGKQVHHGEWHETIPRNLL